MANRYEKSMYEYYKEYHRDLVDIVYNQATTSSMKRIFQKKWGQNLRGGVLPPLTDHEQALFLEYDETFKKYLNIAQKLKLQGYNLKQIKEYFSSSIHPTISQAKAITIYQTLNDVLSKYNITMQELLSILGTLPKNNIRCFILYYGINRPNRVSIDQIHVKLNLEYADVIANIQIVYNALEKYKIEQKVNTKLPPVEEKRTWKLSIYDYFTPEEKEYVTKAIEWYRNHKIKYFDVILKCYGRNYNQWNAKVKLTKEEENLLDNIIGSDLPKLVNQIKHNNLNRGAGAKRKKSIYDYFEETQKEKVKEIIGLWKTEKTDYYHLIVKLYGEDYDYLDTTIELTEEETKLWNHVLADLKDCVYGKKGKSTTNKANDRQRKESIYAYFKEDEKAYVTERIEWWKTNNKERYDLVVKLYGPTYDCLDTKVQLTEREKQLWGKLLQNLRTYISKRKKGPIKSKSGKKKESIYAYFKEDEKAYVTERIEWWKTNNPDYYNLIVKLYGPTYDCLDTKVQLTEREKQLWGKLLQNLRAYVSKKNKGSVNSYSPKKKESNYDYFKEDEKVYVTERIEWWKTNNPDYYNLIVKLYGPTYDKLNSKIELIGKEPKIFSNIITQLRTYISKRKQGVPPSPIAPKTNSQEMPKPIEPAIEVDKTALAWKTGKDALNASPQELVLLAYYEQHDEIKEQELCDVLGISIEVLDCFYVKYLHLFGEQIPQVIEIMITRDSNNVNRILNESYLKEFMLSLTAEEKIYIQLKLQSYADPSLTDEVIANWVGLTVQDVEQYEIVTPYDELNQLNQLIKK